MDAAMDMDMDIERGGCWRLVIGALLIIQVLCLAGLGYVTASQWAWRAADGATVTTAYVVPGRAPAHPVSTTIARVSVTRAREARQLQYWMNETTVAIEDDAGGRFVGAFDPYSTITVDFTWHGIIIESARYDTRYLGWAVTVLGYVNIFQAHRVPKDGATPVLDELLATYPQLAVR